MCFFSFSIQELANLRTAAQETGHMEEIKWTPDCQIVFAMSAEFINKVKYNIYSEIK